VLTGQPLPLRPPFFGGVIPEPAAEAVVAEVEAIAADAAADDGETSTSAEKMAPIFANQAGSARKRSLEKTTATETGESKRPRAESSEEAAEGKAFPPLRTALSEESTYESEEAKGHATNPTYTVPTQWEHLYFKQVEVINVNNRLAKEKVQAKRFAGEPFLRSTRRRSSTASTTSRCPCWSATTRSATPSRRTCR